MLQSTMWQNIVSLFFLFLVTATLSIAQPAGGSQLDAIWSTVPTTNNPDARHENGFVAYNGKLYLLGGRGLKRVQIFDPVTNTWSDGAFPDFQMHHFQAVVYNDLIYVIGAYTGTCCDAEFGVSHVWTYNPQTDSWVQRHEIPVDRRRGSTGAVVYNNKIYIVGGIEGGHGDPATAFNWFDEYDPATGQWKVMPNAPRVRDHYHATVFNDKLYLIGGRNTSVSSVTGATIGAIDVYNFSSNTWSTLDGSKNLPTPRGAASTILYKGEMLVIGGETSQTLAHNETQAFNPITESWRNLASLVVGRHGTQAAIYEDAIYLAAGSAQKGGAPELDSVERYEDASVQLVQSNHSLKPGWNMIGLPISPVDPDFQAIYDDIDLMPGLQPMTWDGNSSYQSVTSLNIGKAYWLRVDDNAQDPQVQTITGANIDALQIQLFQGWNMISGPSCDNVFLLGSSTVPAGAIPEGTLYLFDDGYVPAYSSVFARGRLNKGFGYWVYASNDAILTLQCGASKSDNVASERPMSFQQDPLGKLTISDGALKSRQLLFDRGSHIETNADAYNLPPRSYNGYFDARYRNNKRLIDGIEGDIRVQASRLPLRVTFDEAPENKTGKLVISMQTSNYSMASYDLMPGEYVDINDEEIEMLNMRFVEGVTEEQPAAFTLHGNYPNPFNPSTQITFDLPEDADVEIQVIDLLGRDIMLQQAVHMTAGSQRSLTLNAGALPAGTYVYRVTARTPAKSFSQTGRMVLLK